MAENESSGAVMVSKTSVMCPARRSGTFRRVFVVADLLTLAIMLGTFFSKEGGLFRLVNQGLAILLVIIYVPCHIRFKLRVAPEFYLAGLFILWSVFSGMLIAVDQEWTVSYGIMLTRFVILVTAVSGFVMARKNPASGFLIMVIMGAYFSIWARTSGSMNELMTGAIRYREELGINPNLIGLLSLWGFAGLAFLWGSAKRSLFRAVLVAVAIGFGYTLISTASRKSFIGLLFFLALWIFFCYGRRLIKSMKTMVLVGLLVFGVYYVAVNVVPHIYLGQRLEKAKEDQGLDSVRSGMYAEAWRFFLENPVTGVGLGNFTVLSKYSAFSHSDYAEVLSTTGIVGFVIYFPIYFILWRRIVRVRKHTSDLRIKYQMGVYQALLLTILAIGIGSPNFLILYVWFLLALMIGHTYSLDRGLRISRVPRTSFA